MKRWAEEDIEYLRNNYHSKINSEICKALGKTSNSIRFMAGKFRLKKDYEVICRARKHTSVSLSKEQLEKLYLDECKSIRRIACEFKLGKNTISHYLNKYKIPRRTISESNKKFYLRGGKVWKEGLSAKTDGRIRRATEKMKETLMRLKIERLKQKETEIGEPLKDAINRLYCKERLTQEKIAKKLGISREMVIKLMRQFEIMRRLNFEHISNLKGKNHSQYGKKWEEVYGVENAKKFRAERSAWSRKNIIRRLTNREMPFKDTKIEIKIANELSKRDIVFVPQYRIDQKFVCDFALPKYWIIIECDGDYWHANPKIYDQKNLDGRQNKNIQRDKFKDMYLKRKGWTVMRFFESDIKKSTAQCVNLIEDQIRKVANPFDNLSNLNVV